MKKNQLTRALRIDKFTAAALELVLMEYQSEEQAIKNIPALEMITRPAEEVKKDATSFLRMLKRADLSANVRVVPCESQIGGGSLPLERIPSFGVEIVPTEITVTELENRMRYLPVPVIGRTVNDAILLDMRTLGKSYKALVEELKELEIFEKSCLIERR